MIEHKDSLFQPEWLELRDKLGLIVNEYGGYRKILIALGKMVHIDSIQEYESPSDVPNMEADIINLAIRYATPYEKGKVNEDGSLIPVDLDNPF
jgi:hypothetical protein